MAAPQYRLDYPACLAMLTARLAEPAPGRIQLLSGPRQVGKTTLLLALAEAQKQRAVYAAADAPAAALPGFWERVFTRAEEVAAAHGRAVVLLDEAHLVHDWAARLKGIWDAFRRKRTPVHIVASGSSALHLTTGSRESLAGRFESLVLGHWSTSALASAFGCSPDEAAALTVRMGAYPGAFPLRDDRVRWAAYVRDAIVEPAIGRDLLALQPVRRPALLRQLFAVAASSPAQIVSLQKLLGQLQDGGALETIAHYLALLEEAFLVAAIPKLAKRVVRQRAAPPKLITLSNALVAVSDPSGVAADPAADHARFGTWVENACIAHAWNAGQQVSYWREEPLEVDAVLEGSWGTWAIEVKTGRFETSELRGLLELVRRHPKYRPLVVCDESGLPAAARAEVPAMTWQDFLLHGPKATP